MPRPRSDIAPRILAAARRRFLAQGVDGASLRKIAEDADTNIGMIYYYFPTKEDLFSAVLEEVYEEFLVDIESIAESVESFETRVCALSARFGAMSEHEFDVLRIVIREVLVSSERMGRLFERFTRGHIPVMIRALRGARAAGELSSQISEVTMALALASLVVVPQLVRRRILTAVPMFSALMPTSSDLACGIVDILFNGIRGASGPTS